MRANGLERGTGRAAGELPAGSFADRTIGEATPLAFVFMRSPVGGTAVTAQSVLDKVFATSPLLKANRRPLKPRAFVAFPDMIF